MHFYPHLHKVDFTVTPFISGATHSEQRRERLLELERVLPNDCIVSRHQNWRRNVYLLCQVCTTKQYVTSRLKSLKNLNLYYPVNWTRHTTEKILVDKPRTSHNLNVSFCLDRFYIKIKNYSDTLNRTGYNLESYYSAIISVSLEALNVLDLPPPEILEVTYLLPAKTVLITLLDIELIWNDDEASLINTYSIL